MNRFNAVTSALFDPLLAPFGTSTSVRSRLLSVLGDRRPRLCCEQSGGIARAKNATKVHLLEIRFKDDIAAVLGATPDPA
jgi:hypothetical protein